MEIWSAHQLYQNAESSLGKTQALNLRNYASNLKKNNLPVIFTLRHLSKITGVDYRLLRSTVSRRRESANYRMFAIKKRSGGRRHIHAVTGEIFKVQHFINSEILKKLVPHSTSFAFHSNGGIRKCAEQHCGAKWLFQFDISDFFYSINESDVYMVFKNAGYRPLIAFELSRLCTTIRLPQHLHSLISVPKHSTKEYKLYGQNKEKSLFWDISEPWPLGVLPQGAPSSPMLSNLATVKLDISLSEYANKYGFTYTRYADDITLSCGGTLPDGVSVGKIQNNIISIIRKHHFKENVSKIRVAGPGSKKIVLGLLVDGNVPRLSKQTYKRIERHLYSIKKFGLSEVARHEKFDSPIGFYNHVAGLIAFIKDVDNARWLEFSKKFVSIDHP